MKQKQIRCPYCGSIAILRDASYVYGNKAKDGKLYVCSHFPQCNSYVGVHPGTTNAKGKLANKELRQKRIQAHRVFDQIWLNHIFTKSEAYRWIADKFCLTAKEAHIGEFSTYMCDQLILESMKMEIPVVAPQDGTVASIDVAEGAAVENGDTLATMN